MPDEAPPAPPGVAESSDANTVMDPPKTLGGILRQLGPGLIIAGSIVGSGELIATTAVGAEAGFVLMWLIIIGCLIKVFVQIEFGKYAIMHGKTTLEGMNEVPGPRFGGPRHARVNWINWFWLIFIVVALAQIGGIIGGVGQAVSIQLPLTEQGEQVDAYQSHEIRLQVIDGLARHFADDPDAAQRLSELATERSGVEAELNQIGGVSGADLALLARREKLAALIEAYEHEDTPDGPLAELTNELQAVNTTIDDETEFFEIESKQLAHVRLVAYRQLLREAEAEKWAPELVEKLEAQRGKIDEWKKSSDPLLWATLITLGSIVILVVGRYRLIQNVSTALVASFTLVTVLNLIYLQTKPDWRLTLADLLSGMSFQIPPGDGLVVALAAFGIIGVGATELIQYPYWCLEKGYAKWTGKRDQSDAWASRAEGWIRVLKWDAWCSMVVYTFATITFYLLGAAILGRTGLDPSGDQMVRTLGEMYVPVFGDWAQGVFLFGAFAVLYSTFFVATASHARTLADGMRVFGLSAGGEKAYVFWTRIFCATLPIWFLACFAYFKTPKQLVLAGGFMGALMLPLLGVTALYGRYQRCDDRLRPSLVWDAFLWLSVAGLFLAGGWAFYKKIIEPFVGASA